jgi:hypothetical protein
LACAYVLWVAQDASLIRLLPHLITRQQFERFDSLREDALSTLPRARRVQIQLQNADLVEYASEFLFSEDSRKFLQDELKCWRRAFSEVNVRGLSKDDLRSVEQAPDEWGERYAQIGEAFAQAVSQLDLLISRTSKIWDLGRPYEDDIREFNWCRNASIEDLASRWPDPMQART